VGPNSNRNNGAERRKRRNKSPRQRRVQAMWNLMVRSACFVLFAALLALVMTTGQPPLDVQLGERAPHDYRARADFVSMDIERTRAARERARLAAPPVLRTQPQVWQDSVADLCQSVADGPGAALWQRLPKGFDTSPFFTALPLLQARADILRQSLDKLSNTYLISPEDFNDSMMQERLEGQAAVLGADGQEQHVPVASLIPLDGESDRFREALGPVLDGMDPAQADSVSAGLALCLRPNVVLDYERSREAAEAASAAEPIKTKTVKQGRIILARGREVSQQHLEDLEREREQYGAGGTGRLVVWQRTGGVVVILLIVMAAAAMYSMRYRPELVNDRLQALSFTVLALVLVGLARLFVIWGIPPVLAPVPLMVMAMCLVYDQRFGLVAAVFYSLLVRLACPGADAEFLTLLLGGMTAALLTGQVRTRGTLIKAGLFTGVAQLCAVWGLGLMATVDGAAIPLRFWGSDLFRPSLLALVNGLGSGFVISGMLPAIESLFGVTTDIRLLEWSDPNQPLLQQMLLEAPGTYHHSMVVGSLAADAAEAIGANSLLARVSAYFHDVGKLKKPDYFSENQPEGSKNPHDDLSPTMSSLIITAHPKDGAQMAEEYGVPAVVRDVILQSHGSSLVKYFWGKAQAAGNGHGDVQERTFRYRLPKPRSKEAAIVMLCDAVESATRSMDSHSVGQLRNLVREIMRDRLSDGQLDESGLTIPDLKKLEDSLVHGLAAVFHSRVSYPGQEKLQQEAGETTSASSNTRRDESHADGSL